MIVLTDKTTKEKYNFFLTDIIDAGDNAVFNLSCDAYPELLLNFELQTARQNLPGEDYTVSLALFKNPHHSQSEILDLRVEVPDSPPQKIGYFFRLDALFENGILQLDKHRYCYAYYALREMFSSDDTLQTKEVFVGGNYAITNFFDENTILSVLCEQYCQNIPVFNFDNYLGNLFIYGFTKFSNENPIEVTNGHRYIEDRYLSLKHVVNPLGIYVLRLKSANEVLKGESYITHVFRNLIQTKMDDVTRFLMLYQFVEILIAKVMPYEIRSNIIDKIGTLSPKGLKDMMSDLSKSGNIILSIFNTYSSPDSALKVELRDAILDFFVHIDHPEYADATKHVDLKPTQLFYSLRNKLVHEYREWHKQEIDPEVTLTKMKNIIELTEVAMAEIITKCNLQPLTVVN